MIDVEGRQLTRSDYRRIGLVNEISEVQVCELVFVVDVVSGVSIRTTPSQ